MRCGSGGYGFELDVQQTQIFPRLHKLDQFLTFTIIFYNKVCLLHTVLNTGTWKLEPHHIFYIRSLSRIKMMRLRDTNIYYL
jgi:hypothetical protein